jgi:hypothetical protein
VRPIDPANNGELVVACLKPGRATPEELRFVENRGGATSSRAKNGGSECSDNDYGTSAKNRSVSQLPTFIISSDAGNPSFVLFNLCEDFISKYQTNFVATGRSITNKT